MAKNDSGIRDIKNQHLRFFYKKYTDQIINFEKHIARIYDYWVIDINSRNYILQKLDNLIRQMIKIYNNNLVEIYKDHGGNPSNLTTNLEYSYKNTPYFNLYQGVFMVNCIDNDVKNNPFTETRKELILLAKENGYYNMSSFLDLYFGNKNINFINSSDNELFELYDKVFVPLNIIVKKLKKDNNIIDINKIQITKIPGKCDGQIENTCKIIIPFEILSCKIIFEGYIASDVLNAYIRTSQIYSRYLFNIKNEAKNIVKKMYTDIDDYFIERYTKFINSNYFFVYNTEQLAQKIHQDFVTYCDISTKNFNIIMKEFVHSDILTMFNYINLLLIGDEQCINNAGLLFNLLKDRKIGSETLSDIIFHNLSFFSQIKLKKVTNSIKTELARIKTLTPENISIEKKLATMINMPDNVKSYILEKNNEIKTGENNYKLQMAINGLMQFPWKPKDPNSFYTQIKNSMTKSRNYLQNVAKKLNETVYGHENSKKVLIELVGKWIQNPESTGQVIGLVGPPGVGKTLLAKGISSALGIPLSIVGLGGMSDSADLIGHSFTYAGAQYGMIVRQMIKAGSWRCVMFFDEVDKVSKRNDTNEIYNTLIHITDPNMNQNFQDRFYSSSIDFDLSGVLVVFSYNNSDKLDPILLDRIKEIKISAYSVKEKISIAQNYILKELCENIGFDRNKIQIDDDIIKYIIEKYTMEAGVRELKRKLEQILLKINIDRFYMRGPFRKLLKKKYQEQKVDEELNIDTEKSPDKDDISYFIEHKKSKLEDATDNKILDKIFNLKIEEKIIICKELVHKYLDKPALTTEKIHKSDMIGVINGLYATSVGMGGIIPIQIYKNYFGDNKNSEDIQLKITGNQKQVMKESVICALTTAINLLNKKTKENIFKEFPYGFHVHAPDGGTPKDGPSAGCAFTTAFVSLLLGKKINRFIAMTGEIELTGKISKIGGLDAKLAGAKKAGIKCVYICGENREDYEAIKKKSPELFEKDFEIKIVDHIIDIVTDPNVIIDVKQNDFDENIYNCLKKKGTINL
ncbi:ATP-dependent Lon protease, bacterial type [Acanthamoeba polyphaga moumouvirus]|uniref:ATP-dependent Lon protease, bacterial type n=1 Tax=Acanthamoeba polyphaga moumouvirus TaxID=1269028 RepID=L7RFX4_9VIRU|nr:ATP-dependent Lon protease, bacterial type [Acanthamoeba polyphaga moumouvirus]AGC01815.1 ATP-dependent Lon protease, bacterial type [Acanthamoeba polyphaga moumouvirus]